MTTTPDQLWFMNSHVTVVLAKADNAEGISILDHRMAFGDAPPMHVHKGEDEIFQVLEGEMKFNVGGKVIYAKAGDTLCAPRDVPHGYRVTSPEGARAVTITRGGFEAMVRKASRPAQGAGLPPAAAPTPEMQAMLGALCAAEQIDLLGPPID